MNEEKLTELALKITGELASLNTMMKNALDKLTNHEQRLCNLEKSKLTLKDDAISWLVKGLIAAIMVIASLTGASGLIMKMFGT